MLLQINNQDKRKSKYICDMCKRKLKSTERFVIYVENTQMAENIKRKKYDFCKKCYESMEGNVERGRKN